VILVLLPSMPYSAGNAMTFRSGFIHWDSMRYVALVPLIGWAALGFVIDGGAGAGPGGVLTAVLISGGAVLSSEDSPRAAQLAVGLAAIAAVLLFVGLRLIPWRWRPREGPLLALSLGALTLGGMVVVSRAPQARATPPGGVAGAALRRRGARARRAARRRARGRLRGPVDLSGLRQ